MRRVFLLGLVVTALPSALDAQSVDEQIARAVMAAPANLQADAAVITFDESGEIVVVREGSNGLMCWDSSNEPGRQGIFNAQCTSELNRPRVKQNHQFSHAGGTPEEIQALFDRAEEDGTRELPVYGTMYYHWIGEEDGRPHTKHRGSLRHRGKLQNSAGTAKRRDVDHGRRHLRCPPNASWALVAPAGTAAR